MKKSDKTREQLLKELEKSNKRIAELEKSEAKRKQVEEALRGSELNFCDLVGNLLDGVAIVDENGKHIYVNSKFCEITGYSKEELLNMTGWDFTRPQDRAMLEQRMKDRIAGKPILQHYDRIILKKDGTEVSVEMSTTVTIWQGKNRPFAIIHDITKRKQAEEALRDSRYMLQTVLDSIPATVFWKDRDLIYLGGNLTFLEAVGLKSSEELVGKSDYELPWGKKQADSFREDDRRVMESGIPKYEIIELYLRADDTHAWARTNKVPLRDMEGNIVGVLGTFEDITERKLVERELQEKMNELETFYRATLGREGRVIELKQEVNGLLEQLGEKKKYKMIE